VPFFQAEMCDFDNVCTAARSNTLLHLKILLEEILIHVRGLT